MTMRYYDTFLALGLTMVLIGVAYGLSHLGVTESAEKHIAFLALYLAILTKLKQNP